MRDGVFDPADVTKLVGAFTVALESTGDGSYSHIPDPLLRRILARQIILEASRGESDPGHLAEAALRSLKAPLPLAS